ncbi:hypothetical protein [Flavobacterium sp. 3-210]
MVKKISIAIIFSFCSCKQSELNATDVISKEKTNAVYKPIANVNLFEIFTTDTIVANESYWKNLIQKDSLNKEFKVAFADSFPLKNKTITFLWTETKYGILINEDYCKTISEPERAALAFISNNALSNGSFNKTMKDCNIEIALNLDYQCSNKYKYYLQLWFRNDISSLETIKNCYKMSDMASVQSRFDEITLNIQGNKIFIDSKFTGFNRDIWDCVWTENFVFLVNGDNIKLIKKTESETEFVYHSYNCSDVSPPDGYVNYGNGEYRLPKKSKKK